MITFRKMIEADLPLLAATRQKVWAATYRGIYDDEMIDNFRTQWHIERDRKRMADPEQDFFLAMDGEVCIGYFYYGTPHTPLNDHVFCLNALYFLPEYQGRGLGRRVFDQVREICRSRGIPKFFNGCNLHNLPAQGFYRHMGGVVVCVDGGHAHKGEDQMYFEYTIGEEICKQNP